MKLNRIAAITCLSLLTFIPLQAQWDQEMDRIIQSGVGAFNELYAALNYPALIVPAVE